MIERINIVRTLLAVTAVSLFFGVLGFFNIRFQFYWWEILFDLKILSFAATLFYVNREAVSRMHISDLPFLSIQWKKNFVWFSVPIVVYAAVIGLGIAAGMIKIEAMDNAVTLILATLFDIPAIYVFSATTIFIEEYLFRGIMLRSIEREYGRLKSAGMIALLWSVFMVSDIVGAESFNPLLSSVLFFFFLSLGLFLSVLSFSSGSVWFGYSLRIGLITVTPIILTSKLNESDSFFRTDSLLFIAEGIVFSLIAIIPALWILYRNHRKMPGSGS